MKYLLLIVLSSCFQAYSQIPAGLIGNWEGTATYYEDLTNTAKTYVHRIEVTSTQIKQISGGIGGTEYISDITPHLVDPNYFTVELDAQGSDFGDGSGYCNINFCNWSATATFTTPNGWTYNDSLRVINSTSIFFSGFHIDHNGDIFTRWSATLTKVP